MEAGLFGVVNAPRKKEGYIRTIDWISDVRHGGNVKRHHNYPIIGEQRVAAHTWGVMVLADKLYPDHLDSHLMQAILYHDVPEFITGDIPKNAKWKSQELAAGVEHLHNMVLENLGIKFKLDTKQHYILKICDCLELMFFCLEQRALGNMYSERVFNKIVEHSKKIFGIDEIAKDLIYDITKEYGEILGFR